jgi:hypothetical protein
MLRAALNYKWSNYVNKNNTLYNGQEFFSIRLQEVCKLMLQREALRSRIEMKVAANKKADSSKIEDSKTRRGKTRIAIDLISYRFMELRDILPRLVVVRSHGKAP